MPDPTPPQSVEELQSALAASLERERQLRAFINRMQMIAQSAQGNIQRVTKEMQEMLRGEAVE